MKNDPQRKNENSKNKKKKYENVHSKRDTETASTRKREKNTTNKSKSETRAARESRHVSFSIWSETAQYFEVRRRRRRRESLESRPRLPRPPPLGPALSRRTGPEYSEASGKHTASWTGITSSRGASLMCSVVMAGAFAAEALHPGRARDVLHMRRLLSLASAVHHASLYTYKVRVYMSV